MNIKIYHNPRCSKSRSTLQLLYDKSIQPQVCEYLKSFPTKEELLSIIKKLDVPATEIIRFKETRAKEMNLSASDSKTNEEWVDILIENPSLLERPIVVHEEKAIIGRPPENVLSIL